MKFHLLQKGVCTMAAVSVALSLAGCGAESSSSDQTSQAAASASPQGQTAEKVNLKVMITSLTDKADGPFLLSVMDKYMAAHPNVKIEPIAVPMNDLFKKLQTLASANEMPDIFTNSTEFKLQAENLGIATDMGPLLGSDYLKEFIPQTVSDAKVGDKLVYVPWQYNINAMVYRKDWFEDEGIAIPKTWDEFLAAAKKLTKDTNGDGKVDRWGFALPAMRNQSAATRFIYMLNTFDVYPLRNTNGSWSTDVGSEKFNEAMKFITDLALTHKVTPPGVIETGYAEAAAQIASNQAGMMISQSNVLGAILSQNPDLKGKLGSFPLPYKYKQLAPTATLGMSISSKSKNKEVAADFLKFLLNDENSLEWSRVTKRLPSRTASLEKITAEDKQFQGYVDSTAYIELLPNHENYSKVFDIMGEAYQEVLANGTSVENASQKAAGKVNGLLK